MVDLHAHILPAVDDGAGTLEEAIGMLREARSVGVTRIIATPHMRRGSDIRAKANAAYAALAPQALALGIELRLGYEVNASMLATPEILPSLCFDADLPDGKRALLLEMEPSMPPVEMEVRVTEWIREGIVPILAHPERMAFVQARPEVLMGWTVYGCLLQLDAESIMAPGWTRVRRTAEKLLRGGFVHYVASDAHRPGDYKTFANALKRTRNRL